MIKPKGRLYARRDIFSKKKRSQIMSAVKSKNTKLEKTVISALKKEGLKFKTYYVGVIGKPDIAIPSIKKAVFIDSDFWHGWHYAKWAHKLTSNFWTTKIESNRKRDIKVNRVLRKNGWKVLRVWEHQIKKDPGTVILKLFKFLK